MSEMATQTAESPTAGSTNNNGAGSTSTDADRFGYGGDWTSALLNNNSASTQGSDPADNSAQASTGEGGEAATHGVAGRTDSTADTAASDFDVEAYLRGLEQGDNSAIGTTDTTDGDDGADDEGNIPNVPYARFREVNERAKAAAALEAEKSAWEAEKAQIQQAREQEAEVLRTFGVSSVAEIPAAIEAYNRQQQARQTYDQIQQERANVQDDYSLSDEHRALILKNLDVMEQRLFSDAQLAQQQQQMAQAQASVQAQQEFIANTLRTQAIQTVAASMPYLSDTQKEILSYYDPADIPTVAASYKEYAEAYFKAEAPKLVDALKKSWDTLTPEGRNSGSGGSGSNPQRNRAAEGRDPDSMGWTEALMSGLNRRGSA